MGNNNDSFIEDFFDSSIYKEVLARNDNKGEYVVLTNSDSTYFLQRDTDSCIQLHFPEEIEVKIALVNS